MDNNNLSDEENNNSHNNRHNNRENSINELNTTNSLENINRFSSVNSSIYNRIIITPVINENLNYTNPVNEIHINENDVRVIEEEIENKTEGVMQEGANNIFTISEDIIELFGSFFLQIIQHQEESINDIDVELLIRGTILLMINRTILPIIEIVSAILNYSLTSNNYIFVDNYETVYNICREEVKRFFRISIRYIIIRNILNSMNEENLMEDVRLVMKREEIDKIRTIKYQEKELKTNDEKCAICLEDFMNDDECRELRCSHIYHINCIDNWLLKHSYKCPCCREGAGQYYYDN